MDIDPARSFVRVAGVDLAASEDQPRGGLYDAAHALAYFAAIGTPPALVRVDVDPSHAFARLDAATLDEAEGLPWTAVLDGGSGFAYLGTLADPGRVVRVDVDPGRAFTRLDAVTLATGEGDLVASAIDAAAGLAWSAPRTIRKIVRLHLAAGAGTVLPFADGFELGDAQRWLASPNDPRSSRRRSPRRLRRLCPDGSAEGGRGPARRTGVSPRPRRRRRTTAPPRSPRRAGTSPSA